MQSDWKKEIVKKMPWSVTFLIASFAFFRWTDYEIVAWICLIVAIIALFLVIRFQYYEKIIDRQEKQIKQYCKQALDSQIGATKAISDMNTSVASRLGQYSKEAESQTETKL